MSDLIQPLSLRRSPRKHPSSAVLQDSVPQSSIQWSPSGLKQTATSQVIQNNDKETPFAAFSESTRLQRFYTYLTSQSTQTLRAFNKGWRLKCSHKNKTELIARLLLFLLTESFKEKTLQHWISKSEAAQAFISWEHAAIARDQEYNQLPSVQSLLDAVPERERKVVKEMIRREEVRRKNAYEDGGQQAQNGEHATDKAASHGFTLNEFARLCVLLRDDERARSALSTAIGAELSRMQLDANITRESFWTVVEHRFNDANVDTKENFRGRIDEVDSNKRPICFRTAMVLKNQFNHVKRLFTIFRERWSASGQNDSSRVPDFLQYTGNGDLTADSKRVYVLFTVCRLGTKDEDTKMLQMTTKLIGEDDAGYEEGIPTGRESEESSGKRRRRSQRDSGDLRSEVGNLSRGLDRLGSASEARTKLLRDQMMYERSKSEVDENDENVILKRLENQNKMMELLEQSAMRYERAQKTNNQIFIENARKALENIEQQFQLISKASEL